MAETRVYLEVGQTWTFACAVDWPGWARKAKGTDAALERLQDYERRYASVVGRTFRPGTLKVIGRVQGNATTDFGAPAIVGAWDSDSVDQAEAKRQSGLLKKCWEHFDRVVARAPAELRKGPRGGSRNRDKIVDHVQEAERGGYAPKFGIRVPPRTAWGEQRQVIVDAVLALPVGTKWPLRYAVRRTAWHVLDHAWEIEDRSTLS
jgi:hypothetical protein